MIDTSLPETKEERRARIIAESAADKQAAKDKREAAAERRKEKLYRILRSIEH